MSRSNYLATAALVWALCPAILHAQAFVDADAHYKVMAANQVEAKRGFLDYAETDLSVGSGTFPDRLDFQRLSAPSTSISQSSGIIHKISWQRHNFEVLVACDRDSGSNKDVNCGTELVTIGNTDYRFNFVNGAWQSIYNDGNRLDQSADQFVFTSRDGDRIIFPRSKNFYQYAGTAHLASTWIFPDGNHLDFTYELVRAGNGGWNDWHHLVSVENAQGYGYRFSYLEPSGGQYNQDNWTNADFRKITISSVQVIAPGCGASCPSVSYGYQSWGGTIPAMKLATVTDALGAVSNFTWTDGRNLVSETQKGSSALKFSATYDARGGVTQLVDAAGQSWGYERKINNAVTDVYMTVVTDPKGGKTSYYFPYAGTITPQTITDPLGHVTTYSYDPASGWLTKVAFPEGNSIEYGYDGRGNLTRVTQHAKANFGAADIAKVAVYPADCANALICNKPSTSDWANNVTDYQYDAGTGLLTARTDPAVNGGVRPQQRYAYGQVQAAWSGTVWRLATLSECRTTASCSGTADETKTSWSYASSLLPTAMTVAAGDNSVSATTATTYDALGNPATCTDPLGRVTT
ncbi:Rhs family protein [Candidatus Burkholderia humilis]|nr:Rhs family protein [Candidatus Burkholderia humilis]